MPGDVVVGRLKAELELDSKKFRSGLQKTSKDMKGMGDATSALSGRMKALAIALPALALAGFAASLKKSTALANFQEKQVSKLTFALAPLGAEANVVSESLQRYASELQQVTTRDERHARSY